MLNEIELERNQTEDKLRLFGRSEHMTSVIFDGNKKNIGKTIKVKINKSNRNTLFGTAIENLVKR